MGSEKVAMIVHFIIQQLAQKETLYNLETHLLFADFMKALDSLFSVINCGKQL
jgi:hypothetical protein